MNLNSMNSKSCCSNSTKSYWNWMKKTSSRNCSMSCWSWSWSWTKNCSSLKNSMMMSSRTKNSMMMSSSLKNSMMMSSRTKNSKSSTKVKSLKNYYLSSKKNSTN